MIFAYILFGLFLLPLVRGSSSKRCPQGWSYHPTFGACYGAASGGFYDTWDSAEQYCNSFGGHLPTIHSFEEFQHIQSYAYLAGDNVWTGFTTGDGGNTFESQDKTEVSSFMNNSTNWCFGDFSQSLGDRCIAVGESYGLKCVFDTDCRNTKMHTVCKKAVDCLDQNGNTQIFPEDSWITNNCSIYNTCWKGKHVVRELPYKCEEQEKCVLLNGNEMCQSPKCREGWRFFNNTTSCYKTFYNVNVSQGEKICKSWKGHIASVHSDEENEFIKRMVQIGSTDVDIKDETLLGLNITYPGQILSWFDGTRFDYSDGMAWPNLHGQKGVFALGMLSDNSTHFNSRPWFLLNTDIVLRTTVCKVKSRR
uniref:C-type lectin domain-containing protein n=1 Tax=Panagrolaimus davidi TaxID=227884 RepID=A0A914P3F1_9BILA